MRLMHKGEPYGHLQLNKSEELDIESLSQYVRAPVSSVSRALQELEKHHVFSKNDDGIIFSRRMVRDEEQRRKANKRLRKHRVTTKKVKRQRNACETLVKRPSSSSSSLTRSKIPKKGSSLCPDDAGPGVAIWLRKENDPDDPGVLHMDADFKRHIADEVQKHSEKLDRADPDGQKNTQLTKGDYKKAFGELTHMLLKDSRLRAIPKSKLSKHRSFRALIVNHFKNRLASKRSWRSSSTHSRASPVERLVAQEMSWESGDDDSANESIAACEKEYGAHKDSELVDGSKVRYCKYNCGYYVAKK